MITKNHKNMVKTITASLITMATLIYSNTPVLAEPPSTYKDFMGPGLLDYLQSKIQTGYFVETFTKIDLRYKARVDSRNTVEKILTTANQASPISTNSITSAQDHQKQASEELKKEINTQNQRRENNASSELASGFKYIPSSNGMITYLRDGLAVKIVNEPVKDEFGNLSLKNTDNMQYNDKRLLIGYEATLRDNLGNISRSTWSGRYSDDSLYYANKDTRANKNLFSSTTTETDSAGNTKLTSWDAIGNYDGKFIRAFHQRIEDSVYGITDFTRTDVQYDGPDKQISYHEKGTGQDGLPYTLNRINTVYNEKGQPVSHRETKAIQQIDNTLANLTIDTNIEYLPAAHRFGRDVEPESNQPLKVTTNTLTEYADGSKKNETSVNDYKYDGSYNLISASSHTDFSGQEAGWIQYTDAQGHTLTRDNANTYSYIDPDSKEIVTLSENQVVKTLKDGNKYAGVTETKYKITENGRPETQQTESQVSFYGQNISPNELQRVERSTSIYDVGMVMYTDDSGLILRRIQQLGRTDRVETTYPLLDPDNTHMKTQDLKYEYKYDGIGNLNDLVLVSGTETGWENSDEKGWHNPYTSVITEEHDVILGKPIRTDQTIAKKENTLN